MEPDLAYLGLYGKKVFRYGVSRVMSCSIVLCRPVHMASELADPTNANGKKKQGVALRVIYVPGGRDL